MPKIGQPPAASVVSPELLSRIPGTSAYRAAHAKQGGMPKINVYDDGGEVSMGSKLGNYAQGTLSKLGAMNKPDEKKPAAAPVDDSTDPLGDMVSGLKNYVADKRVTTGRGNNVMQPSYTQGGGPNTPAPDMPLIPMGNAPVFDEGGDVDVNDGNHQAAILEG